MAERSRLLADTSGNTSIEYGLIAVLIAVVIIVAIQNLHGGIEKTYDKISTNINQATSG